MIVAEACQQKEAVDGLAEGRRRGDSLSTNDLEVSRRKRKDWSLLAERDPGGTHSVRSILCRSWAAIVRC